MPRFIDGASKFQKRGFKKKRALFEKLSEGQSPEALFITCSDSRIDTGLITTSDPGDLFVCRNAGNIIPPHGDSGDVGLTASIEYGVAVLEVPHIVVCGHSGCGAMKAAMEPDSVAHFPAIKEWIGYCDDAVKAVEDMAATASDDAKLEMLIEQNVILQLNNLKTHPNVAHRLQTNDVQLHGWVYDIKTGQIRSYDWETGAFMALDQSGS